MGLEIVDEVKDEVEDGGVLEGDLHVVNHDPQLHKDIIAQWGGCFPALWLMGLPTTRGAKRRRQRPAPIKIPMFWEMIFHPLAK